MSDATILKLADGIVADLEESAILPSATILRRYIPLDEVSLRKLQTLQISVVPINPTAVRDSRSSWEYEYQIDVGVQQKISSADTDIVDPLVLAVLTIANYWAANAPTDRVANCKFLRHETMLWDQATLREHQVFTGVVSLYFRHYRTV